MGKKLATLIEKIQIRIFQNDSGWRFLAGDESEEYLNNPNNFDVFEISTICNYDPNILDILDGKIGESYIRDSNTFKLDF